MKTSVVNEESWKGSVWGVALRSSLLLIVICGIAYPLLSTGLAQLIFPSQANGSMVKDHTGKVVGSELIGQSFTDPSYFQGRVSSIEYNAAGSGSNNYAPSNPELMKRVKASVAEWQKNNPGVPISELPVDLITNSGSGLDPHITPASAMAQVPRISQLRGVTKDQLTKLVDQYTEGRDLGVFGEERVNVLKLNMTLNQLSGK